MSVQTVSSGTQSGIVVTSGNELDVLNAATVVNTTVQNGGLEFLSGGTASMTTVGQGGTEEVGSAGTASATVLIGSVQIIDAGGTASATNLAGTGFAKQIVMSTDLAPVGSGNGGASASIYVSSGGLVLGGSFPGSIFVSSDGTVSSVSGKVSVTLQSGAVGRGNTIQGGVENVLPGGLGVGEVINGANVLLSGTETGLVVSGNGSALVMSGGLDLGATFNGGFGIVSSGGVDSGAFVEQDGGITVLSGGVASATTVAGNVPNAQVLADLLISSGGLATGTVLSSGGLLLLAGGQANGTTVSSGGLLSAFASAAVSGSLVGAGGSAVAQSGTVLSATTVTGGGQVTVYTSAIASGSVLEAGGLLSVGPGGSATGSIVSSGGVETVGYNGNALSSFVNAGGQQTVDANGVASATTIAAGGSAYVAGGGMEVMAVIAGGTLELATSVGAGSAPIEFTGSGGSLVLDQATSLANVLSGFSPSDTVVFSSLNDTAPAFSVSGDLVTVSASGGSYVLDIFGASGMTFTVSGNGASVTLQDVACYVKGSLILTDRGEMPAEVLAIGNILVTASGQHRPIKWLGRRSYAGRFLAANPGVQPIRFRAGSLGNGLPRRDLLVSPEHAMFLDGLLIPARCLVNGSTIVRDHVERVDYFHVELDSHDVLLAEGAPSESFMDDDSRRMFHNAAEFAALYPDAPSPGRCCAPKVDDGYELEAIRRRLAGVAGEMARVA